MCVGQEWQYTMRREMQVCDYTVDNIASEISQFCSEWKYKFNSELAVFSKVLLVMQTYSAFLSMNMPL